MGKSQPSQLAVLGLLLDVAQMVFEEDISRGRRNKQWLVIIPVTDRGNRGEIQPPIDEEPELSAWA